MYGNGLEHGHEMAHIVLQYRCTRPADIWTVAVAFGYDPAANGPLLAVQITKSGNTQTTYELMNIEWSPDAQWLAFDAMPLSISAARQIYKIRADGSGKSATLTNSKKQGYVLTGWRP